MKNILFVNWKSTRKIIRKFDKNIVFKHINIIILSKYAVNDLKTDIRISGEEMKERKREQKDRV